MAYGELGDLLPTEAQYGNPNAYTAEIQAESAKKAAYLASMDQFYKQLDESKRQFDLNYAAREKEFEWTSGFQEKQFRYTKKQDAREMELATRKMDIEERLAQNTIQYQQAQLGYQKDALEFEKQKLQAELEQIRSQTKLGEQSLALQKQLGLGQLGLEQKKSSFEQQMQMMQLQLGMQQAFPQGIQVTQGRAWKAPIYQNPTEYYKTQLSNMQSMLKGANTYGSSYSGNNADVNIGQWY